VRHHHTKTIGDLGVLKAQPDLYQRGYIVSVPLSEHAPFDLVITRDGRSRTVQVKTRRLDATGSFEVKMASTWADRRGSHRVPVDPDRIDLYCVWCPDVDVCFYFDPHGLGSSIRLRVRAPKNGQRRRVRVASDYREVP